MVNIEWKFRTFGSSAKYGYSRVDINVMEFIEKQSYCNITIVLLCAYLKQKLSTVCWMIVIFFSFFFLPEFFE